MCIAKKNNKSDVIIVVSATAAADRFSGRVAVSRPSVYPSPSVDRPPLPLPLPPPPPSPLAAEPSDRTMPTIHSRVFVHEFYFIFRIYECKTNRQRSDTADYNNII